MNAFRGAVVNRLGLVLIVLKKELLDGGRDRRSILSLLFSAMIAPVLLGVMFTVIAERRRNADEIRLPVAGAEHAPMFVEWLRQQTGVEVVPAPADAEQAVRDRDHDVVMIIDKDFAQNMARAIPAKVVLVSDGTRESARPKVARVRSLVATYSSQTGALRLIARGIAPSIATALRIEDVEVSSLQQRAQPPHEDNVACQPSRASGNGKWPGQQDPTDLPLLSDTVETFRRCFHTGRLECRLRHSSLPCWPRKAHPRNPVQPHTAFQM